MAIAHARKIVVGDSTFHWKLRASKDRYGLGWTPGLLTLIISGDDGRQGKFYCRSKHWTSDHTLRWGGESYVSAEPHKVPFGPGQVRKVIDAGLQDCELQDWQVERVTLEGKFYLLKGGVLLPRN